MYISQDPIRLNGGLTLYSYGHDPNTWVDRFGLAEANQGDFNIHGGIAHTQAFKDKVAELKDDPTVDKS